MIGQQTLHDDAAVGVEDRDDAQYSAAVFAADACFLATRLWSHSSAEAVRPRRAIDKTQKARRVDTSLRLKNAYEYTSATPVSHCLPHKESPAMVDRWISRRGIRLHDRYCKESERVRNSSGWIL